MAYPTTLDSFTANVDNVDVIYASDINELQTAITSLETKVGVDSSAVTSSHDYKLGEITSTDKAVGKTATQTVANKTLGTGTKVAIGSDADKDMYYRASDGSLTRIPVGTDNQILKLNGTTPNWEAETVVGVTDYYLDAKVDDIRAWSDARTSGEISANYNVELVGNEANLEGYWKVNNAATDETANANNLTLSGSPAYSTDIPF